MSKINHEEVRERLQRAVKILTEHSCVNIGNTELTSKGKDTLLRSILDLQIFTLSCLLAHDKGDDDKIDPVALFGENLLERLKDRRQEERSRYEQLRAAGIDDAIDVVHKALWERNKGGEFLAGPLGESYQPFPVKVHELGVPAKAEKPPGQFWLQLFHDLNYYTGELDHVPGPVLGPFTKLRCNSHHVTVTLPGRVDTITILGRWGTVTEPWVLAENILDNVALVRPVGYTQEIVPFCVSKTPTRFSHYVILTEPLEK